jgi:hypothetical protein
MKFSAIGLATCFALITTISYAQTGSQAVRAQRREIRPLVRKMRIQTRRG